MPPKRKAAAAGLAPDGPRQVKRWCFTVFEPALCAAPESLLDRDVEYIVYQRELAPGTSRPHLQGFLVLKAKKTLAGVKTLLGDATSHLEQTRGTNAQAADYCRKDASRDPAVGSGPFEKGTMPRDGQGARNDIHKCKELIDSGATDKDVADADFGAWCHNWRAFAEYRAISGAPRRHQTECVVYWGPPGTGKTRAASEYDAPERTFWLPRPSGSSLWWDGYCGHRTVVLDEFYGWVKRDLLQRLVDRTPLRVERKGGSVNFTAHTVVITSNTPPDLWWKRVGLGAMQRRLEEPIGVVIYVGNAAYPTADSYRATLEPAAPAYYATSDDVPLGAMPGQF